MNIDFCWESSSQVSIITQNTFLARRVDGGDLRGGDAAALGLGDPVAGEARAPPRHHGHEELDQVKVSFLCAKRPLQFNPSICMYVIPEQKKFNNDGNQKI